MDAYDKLDEEKPVELDKSHQKVAGEEEGDEVKNDDEDINWMLGDNPPKKKKRIVKSLGLILF